MAEHNKIYPDPSQLFAHEDACREQLQRRFPKADPDHINEFATHTVNFQLEVANPEFRKWWVAEQARIDAR